jgi:hypothetical protein
MKEVNTREESVNVDHPEAVQSQNVANVSDVQKGNILMRMAIVKIRKYQLQHVPQAPSVTLPVMQDL